MHKDLAYEVLWSVVRMLTGRLRETNDKLTFLSITGNSSKSPRHFGDPHERPLVARFDYVSSRLGLRPTRCDRLVSFAVPWLLALVFAASASAVLAAARTRRQRRRRRRPPRRRRPRHRLATGTAATPPSEPAEPTGPAVPAGTPVQATALLAEVKKAGVDPAKNPVLEKMSSADKKKVMPFFVKALGYKDCTGCHASLSDYKTVTHNMQIARGMWDHFVAYGRDTSDGVMFCDSCHAGSAKILNRADRDGVKKFMESDYVGKIHRADKKPMECTTCHSDKMELDIFGKVWGIK